MPTLIRLLITLLFLAGLVYAGMFALITFVEPTPKERVVRIPQRDLLAGGQAALPGSEAPAADATEPAAEPAAPAESAAPVEPLTD